jgi:glycosyltransferase involved in cell wall biosynthesis
VIPEAAAEDRRLHVAIVPQNPVLPLDNGGKIRNFHLFRALAQRHRVSVLLTQPPPEPQLQELREAGMDPISLPKPALRHLAYLRHLARGVPVDFAVQANPSVAGWLRRHAREVDVVLVVSIGSSLSVPRGLGHPVAVDTQNVEWVRRASDLSADVEPLRRFRRRALGAGTAAFERRVLGGSDRVYVCSADERALLRAAGVEHVAVVPNGVDVEGIRPAPEPPDGDLVLFPGDLGYPPNIVGSLWIAGEIAPAIRARAGRCRLLVAGRDASADLRATLAAANVEVRSPVADMWEVLAESSIVLVPLRSGGGTRLKILEAFGAGRAVVSTRLGAEGIEAEHGRHLLIADTAEGIADAVAGLLADPARRREMAAEARRLAEERYGWAAIGAGMADDLEALVAGSPAEGVAAATGAGPRGRPA